MFVSCEISALRLYSLLKKKKVKQSKEREWGWGRCFGEGVVGESLSKEVMFEQRPSCVREQ